MKTPFRRATIAYATVATIVIAFAACKKEPLEIPEPEVQTNNNTYVDDSTGLVINEGITVVFGEKEWSTREYTTRIDTISSLIGTPFEWVTIEAHATESALPKLRLVVLKELGSNSAYLSVVAPEGVGYTVPGDMNRGMKGGDLFYYDSIEIYQPDGTRRSDWRPLELTTTVVDVDNFHHTMTATANGLLFHFGQWLDSVSSGHPINVAAADTCSISINLGNISLEQ